MSARIGPPHPQPEGDWMPEPRPDDDFFTELFGGTRLMVILRGLAPEAAVARAETAWDHGVQVVEVTVAVETALDTLAAVVEAGRRRGAKVGAGSVYRTSQVRLVAAAGATFAVSPGLSDEVSRECRERGLPHLPGVSTPSEVAHAETLGHRWLKAFPASELGSGWITAMHGPFPWPQWVATGGISVANADAFLKAGARALGMGGEIDDWDAARFLVAQEPRPGGPGEGRTMDMTKETGRR